MPRVSGIKQMWLHAGEPGGAAKQALESAGELVPGKLEEGFGFGDAEELVEMPLA